MEDLLKRLGLKKVALARALGIKPGTVYRWTDETCPRHVRAYLELRVLYEEEKEVAERREVLPSAAVPAVGVDDHEPEEVPPVPVVPERRGRRGRGNKRVDGDV